MDDWLAHPAVQAALVPFIAAFAVGWPLRRSRWIVLAIAAALASTGWLTVGFSLESLTATRKLVLAGLAACLIVPCIEQPLRRWPIAGCAVVLAAAAGAATWVLWRLWLQADANQAFGLVVGTCVVPLLVAPTLNSAPRPACSGALVLAGACAVLAVFGASIVLAQLGAALAAGSAALLLVQWRGGGASRLIALPVALCSACIALLSVVTGGVTPYALLPLAAIPWVARHGAALLSRPVILNPEPLP